MRQAYCTWLATISLWGVALLGVTPVQGEPLPRVEDVLRKLVDRSQNPKAAETEGYYLCTKKTVTEDMDSGGRVTNRKVKVGQSRSDSNGAKDANKWSSKNGFSFDDELLQRFQFTLAKRETFNGRPTFLVTFVPKQPALPVRRLQDRLLNRAIGTLWIDEEDYELVKASISLKEAVSFGILGAVERLNFGFERAHTETGTWLTRWTDTSFKGRKFVIPVQFRKRVDCTDFTRLTPETEVAAPEVPGTQDCEPSLANGQAQARSGQSETLR